YLNTLKLILSYLGVSDCDMEKGSLRCDANVSIRPVGQETFGTKTELKNMNSFSAVKRAIEHEVTRQERLILSGGKVTQETLLWDEARSVTVPMRSKEEAHDYRYFPEPDLVPFTLKGEEIEAVRQTLPEGPFAKLARLKKEHGITDYDGTILVQDPALADLFEGTVGIYPEAKKVCNWINVQVMKEVNDRKCSLRDLALTPENLAGLIRKVEEGVISNLVGKELLSEIVVSGKSVAALIEERGLAQTSDEGALESVVDEVLAANPGVVEQIRSGKTSAAGFLVGQAMKKMGGKAHPKKLNEIIQRKVSNA
ncbi:MAG: Asp-tRNA(Asn)/Glu-tRNA(Gln) amidotransferase subunit GatB, partial [Elusimicrobia bacterium]|nr:Asp-tRNA(Asn)/Glu-tRNA(Gln) amidotransferase subunit GatB [Elusimicrobiota bacterium]